MRWKGGEGGGLDRRGDEKAEGEKEQRLHFLGPVGAMIWKRGHMNIGGIFCIHKGAHHSNRAGIHWIVWSPFSIVIRTDLHTHRTKTLGHIR